MEEQSIVGTDSGLGELPWLRSMPVEARDKIDSGACGCFAASTSSFQGHLSLCPTRPPRWLACTFTPGSCRNGADAPPKHLGSGLDVPWRCRI